MADLEQEEFCKMSLETFMRSRQISQDTIDYFTKENIDVETILLMDEDELKKYIPKCGDRICLLRFCRRTKSTKKQSLIEKLRDRMELKRKNPKASCSKTPDFTKKPTRMVEVGWMCANNKNKDYRQVRATSGGGTRRITVQKESKCSEILQKAKDLFFPNGTSTKGHISLFDYELLDFKSNTFASEDLTIEEMYEITAVKTLRFYLATAYKHETSFDTNFQDPESELPLISRDSCLSPRVTTRNRVQNLDDLLAAENSTESQIQEDQCSSEMRQISNEYNHLVNSILDGFDHDVNNTATDMPDSFPLNELLDCGSTEDTENIPETFEDVVKTLQKSIISEVSNTFNVFREEMFTCCVRAMRRQTFSPYNKIYVKFSDMEGTSEGAIDEGGPTRELFRLVINFIKDSPMFIGSNKKHISLNATALNNRHYYEAGRIIALSLVHGGPAPHFFSDFLFNLIIGQEKKISPTLNDVEEEIKSALIQLENTESLSKAQNFIADTNIFTIAGYNFIFDLQEKSDIIEGTLKFYATIRIRDALAQFIEGLKTCDVYHYMTKFPDLFKSPMCDDVGKITAEKLETIFEVSYSPIGSNTRQVENRIITYFRDYLLECEGNDSDYQNQCTSEEKITLVDILIFATGADQIPPLGFPLRPKITFLHDDPSPYPKANTCALELKLPISHKNYEAFISALNFAFANCNSFGFA